MHRFKQVHITTGSVSEHPFTSITHPSQYDPYMSRAGFLELINDWNRISVLQSKATGKVDWLYFAI